MIEKLHFLYLEYMRNKHSVEEPTAILMNPQDWYTACREAMQLGSSEVMGNQGERKNQFRGIPVFRTMDLEPGDIKILR